MEWKRNEKKAGFSRKSAESPLLFIGDYSCIKNGIAFLTGIIAIYKSVL
jgi:hypothetical protein